jgi:hypothetical protein
MGLRPTAQLPRYAGGRDLETLFVPGRDDHPAFPQVGDAQAALWRYMDREKFFWLVNNERLFMAAADRLGDPLEGTAPQGESDWWAEHLRRADDEKRQIIEYNKSLIGRFQATFRDHYYVSCWHLNEGENTEMWKFYTSVAEAVAIRTRYATLRRLLPTHVFMGRVQYADYTNTRATVTNMFDYIMLKDARYAFESEVRAVACTMTVDPDEKAMYSKHLFSLEASPEFRVYAPPIDVAELVEEIVLAPGSSKSWTEEVADLCSGKALPSPSSSQQRESGA